MTKQTVSCTIICWSSLVSKYLCSNTCLMPAWGCNVTSQCCHLETEASMYFDQWSSYETSVLSQAWNKLRIQDNGCKFSLIHSNKQSHVLKREAELNSKADESQLFVAWKINNAYGLLKSTSGVRTWSQISELFTCAGLCTASQFMKSSNIRTHILMLVSFQPSLSEEEKTFRKICVLSVNRQTCCAV